MSQSMQSSPNLTESYILLDDLIEYGVFPALEKIKPRISSKVVNKLIEILTVISFESDGKLYVERDHAYYFLQNFIVAVREGDGRYLFIKRGLKVDRVVDVEEFVKSREYMDLGMTIRPKLMELLWELFHGENADNYLEVALGGSIGWGKSFFSDVASAYLLYKLSCYHSPQLEYKLAPGSPIVFTMQSVRLEQAKRVLFQPFYERIRRSPYFQRYFPFDATITTEMRFPNSIVVLPLSSSDTAALGYNVYSAVLDELNFLAYVEDSIRARSGEDVYDQAAKLYLATLRRVRSRFQIAGKAPGKIFLISSANYPGDFMDRKFAEAEQQAREGKRRTIFPVRLARWEVFPPGTFSSEVFYVEVGDAVKKSRIIARPEDAIDQKDVLTIPIDFKDDFEKDLEAAIRDIAGVPVGGVNSFIKQRDKIADAAKLFEELYGGVSLFTDSKVNLTKKASALFSVLDLQYLEQIEDPSLTFVAHVDLGLSGDSCGVSVAHFSGMQSVGRSFNWDSDAGRYVEVQGGEFPAITIDGVLEVTNDPGDEVDIALVGDLLLTIASHVNLVVVTSDRFQSAALLQKMRKARNVFGNRIKTAVISVDVTLAPYMELKQAIRDGRILYPPNAKLLKELRELQLDPARGKVDHPKGGSKDLSDAVAGSVYAIVQLHGRGSAHHRRRGLAYRRLRNSVAGSSGDVSRDESERRLRVRRLH